MSKLNVSNIEPASGTNVDLGTTGDDVVVSGNTLKIAKMVDSGGNTLFQSASGVVSNVNSGMAGAGPSIISGVDVTAVSSISVTTGITSAYSEYWIVFTNFRGDNNGALMQISWTSDGTNFDVSTSTTFWRAQNDTGGGGGSMGYQTGEDSGNDTNGVIIAADLGAEGEERHSGILKLYNPASTSLAKHFQSRIVCYHAGDYAQDNWVSGRINTTSAITGYKLDFSAGGFDAASNGRIDLYGVT